jgi:hypothetical protein
MSEGVDHSPTASPVRETAHLSVINEGCEMSDELKPPKPGPDELPKKVPRQREVPARVGPPDGEIGLGPSPTRSSRQRTIDLGPKRANEAEDD